MKIGLAPHKLTSEGRALREAWLSLLHEVTNIDPHKTWAALEYNSDGETEPKIYHDGTDISDLDILLVRRSHGYGAAIGVMSRALELCGCSVVDPSTRYSVGYSSKITTSLRRYKHLVGSETYYAFYLDGAHDMITHLRRSKRLPAIVKPVDGKRSRGRRVVKTAKRLRPIAEEFFANRKSKDVPFYVQPFEDIVNEYRVLMVNGYIISTIEKIKKSRTAVGSRFVQPKKSDDLIYIETTCKLHCANDGIVGIDVAKTSDGRVIIIEENRAPGWRRFQDVIGFDVAEAIVDALILDTN